MSGSRIDPLLPSLSSGENKIAMTKQRILLVDDNESAAHLMSRLLQKLGQEVHVAASQYLTRYVLIDVLKTCLRFAQAGN